MARQIEVTIVGDASSLQRAFRSAADSGSKFGSALRRTAKVAGLALGAGALGGLYATMRAGIGDMVESARVTAQTEAVLRSTGKAAGVTAKDVEDLAQEIMGYSGLSDEAVQSGENLLLTFTRIRNEVGKGNDIFDQATRVMADMSVALGQSMRSSAIQLGKALNDPIRGITALRRVGVSFTDAQQAEIRALVTSGRMLEAQKMILRELQVEFGGSAKAAGETLPGKLAILREQFASVAGEAMTKMLPALTRFVSWVNEHWPQISATISAVVAAIAWAINNVLVPVIRGATAAVRAIVEVVQRHWPQISATAMRVFGAVREIVTLVVERIRALWARFGDEIVAIVRAAFAMIGGVLRGAFEVIRGIFNVFAGLLRGDWDRVWTGLRQIVGGVMQAVVAIIRGTVTIAFQAAQAVAEAIIGPIRAAANRLGGLVARGLTALANAFSGVAAKVWALAGSIGSAIIDGIWHGFAGKLDWLKGKIEGAIGFIKDLNPFSPVAHGGAEFIGRPLARGVAEGFAAASGDLSHAISERLRAAVEAGRRAVEAAGAFVAPGVAAVAAPALARSSPPGATWGATGTARGGVAGAGGGRPLIMIEAGMIVTDRQLEDVVARAMRRVIRRDGAAALGL